ncbi:capsid protein [Parvoviridae sp.]|uniref:Capsid protein n=1 Tax=Grus japonensis parvovirus 4 TaxID=3071219 RepID=A0A2K9YND6_9VIRU|nr:capsid protein [Parvoviridae sp.]AUW34322.1 capsid protein [Grus japonensis parvovirus 4]
MFLPNLIGRTISPGYTTSMAHEITYRNVYCTYITNNPYNYPSTQSNTANAGEKINTGWHVLPNQLMQHFMTQGQWVDLINRSGTYSVKSIQMDIFNMIPMTETIAINGTTPFWAFNNCVYALAYADNLHETNYYNWMEWQTGSGSSSFRDNLPNTSPNLIYKEGKQCTGAGSWVQQCPPTYSFMRPLYRVSSNNTWCNSNQSDGAGLGVYPSLYSGNTIVPSAAIWDPLNNPDELMELRPGKNSITFQHTIENSPFFNSDMFAYTWPYSATGPYQGNQRPGCFQQTEECDPDELAARFEGANTYNDFTIPNYANQPVIPSGWWWHEMKSCIADVPHLRKPNEFWNGTERETTCSPIPQWFIKIIPLWRASQLGGQPSIVPCIAQVAVRTHITFEYTPRRSAFYTPTAGPWSWYDLYSIQPHYRNFKHAAIRARTAGLRRTWQNFELHAATSDPDFTGSAAGHKREDPYKESVTIGAGTGTGGTYTTTIHTRTARQTPTTTHTSSLTLSTPISAPKKGHDNLAYDMDTHH